MRKRKAKWVPSRVSKTKCHSTRKQRRKYEKPGIRDVSLDFLALELAA